MQCDKSIEILQKFSDRPVTRCTFCGANKLQKKIAAPNFQLSGSGWYNDGYGTKAPTTKSKGE
ncbi:MAG: hypothetical protein CMF41_06900 [Legionellales bacterium]|nr:hypothetical protein [Legionellales bacterium]OUX63773.1 MAG: hypothetical protein CBE41_04555 [Gammaproteobacteria bacterium TMED281]